jgi:hypothetical protein
MDDLELQARLGLEKLALVEHQITEFLARRAEGLRTPYPDSLPQWAELRERIEQLSAGNEATQKLAANIERILKEVRHDHKDNRNWGAPINHRRNVTRGHLWHLLV